ncbi:LGFP repeat-containing protein [Nocardia suismassiliense]|uniref:LGFP repeat-containing protein n=1 Tax=Nocardia suismassiliense TaxID=2077092 RepID=A0ABW6R1T5_9NOCA
MARLRRTRAAFTMTTATLAVLLTAGTAAGRPIGPFDVGGAIEVEYDQAGGGAVFGDPVIPESDAGRGGKYQAFERNSSIYWHPATGAHQVGGAIRDKWGNLGWENGFLGYPVTREAATPSKPGRYNHFQGGSIYWSVGTAAHQIGGAIRDKWGSYGWENSPLGFPITDEAPAKNNGRYNLFNDGAIYWSGATGAHVVWGAIRTTWEARAGVNGGYGYPTSDEYDYQNGKAQDFQGGRITWQP